MKNSRHLHWLFSLSIFLAACQGQNPADSPGAGSSSIRSGLSSLPTIGKIDTLPINKPPTAITRSMIQDKDGDIWLATFEGIFKYNGTSFSNMSRELSSNPFFSVLEDTKGNLWFGSIGAGVYHYDGQSFQNFTTADGLVNNEVVCIYEDKSGNIWFGANTGVSRYNGESFQNYTLTRDSTMEARKGSSVQHSDRPSNEVNSIIEDKTGKFWFATRGNTFLYDGQTFTTVQQNGQPFTNVRWIIEDKEGNIWLGGQDGLWRYDGLAFSKITKAFVGYIYEDTQGNIWTTSRSTIGWAISRYDVNSLDKDKRIAVEIKSGEGMFFGILEDADGNFWFGTLHGVYRYDGSTFDDFKG